MNKLISSLMLMLLAVPAAFGQTGAENDPAYLPIDKVLDFKTIRPEVNVNLPRFLLKDAAAELSSTNGGFPALGGLDIGDLIKDVKLIRVVVIEVNQTNRPAMDKAVKTLQAELQKKWTPIVTVPEDNVGVYAMGDPAGEQTTGLAVLVYDGDDAVIANVVGHVSVGKLIKLAAQSDKLPKDLLKKLQGFGNQSNSPASTTSGDDTRTNTAPEKPKAAPKESAEK